MSPLRRLDGWEGRLAAVIAAARVSEYVLGEADCLRLACRAVEALTGVDYWPRIVGKRGYKTKRGALLIIARIAGSLGEAVTATLGIEPAPTRRAQRGDIVLFRDPDNEDHLGVCIGAQVLLTAPWGSVTLPITDARLLCAWRIG